MYRNSSIIQVDEGGEEEKKLDFVAPDQIYLDPIEEGKWPLLISKDKSPHAYEGSQHYDSVQDQYPRASPDAQPKSQMTWPFKPNSSSKGAKKDLRSIKTQQYVLNKPGEEPKDLMNNTSKRNIKLETDDHGETPEELKEDASMCRRFWQWIVHKIKPNNFWSIYIRLALESFLGIMLITTNEIKTNEQRNSNQTVSLVVSWIVAILYASFYVFV